MAIFRVGPKTFFGLDLERRRLLKIDRPRNAALRREPPSQEWSEVPAVVSEDSYDIVKVKVNNRTLERFVIKPYAKIERIGYLYFRWTFSNVTFRLDRPTRLGELLKYMPKSGYYLTIYNRKIYWCNAAPRRALITGIYLFTGAPSYAVFLE